MTQSSVPLDLQSQIDQLRAGLTTEIEQLREENKRLRTEVSICYVPENLWTKYGQLE